ncbi:helix-turn-helix transcriptional regulator [Priestia megaterium]|uniref:helix-turn-helix transcriptional regulator n=1 Tax=Priestia megaterium TaxID=1404 RepID=UPI003000B42C
MESTRKGPYNHDYEIDVRYLKQVRLLRDLTLKEMGNQMGIADSVLCRLEKGRLKYTPVYHKRFKLACGRLKISNTEARHMAKTIELRDIREGRNSDNGI